MSVGPPVASTVGLARTAHSERVLASLLRPAAAMIREKGILGASVEDFVEAVGISKGTLYYHIRTKEGLLYWISKAVIDEGHGRWVKAISETEHKSPSATLRRMVEEYCDMIHTHQDCIAVLSEEAKYLSPDMRRDIEQKTEDFQGLLESVLERGLEQGEFAVSSAKYAASIVVGTLASMYRWYSPSGKMSPAELADIATQLLMDGLHGAQPRPA